MEDMGLLQTLRDGTDRVVFDRFQLIRELGSGGMAVVWLAHDQRLDLEVALKFLPGMVAKDPEALHDLRREITRGLKLTHIGIVRLFDLHEDALAGLAAISMEYIDGSTLAEEKASQPDRCFDVSEQLITWVGQLADVLSFVHDRALIVHRDLKPRNLMMNRERELKVADFGIAATLGDSHSRLTQNVSSSGTPLYMSPQQAAGRRPTPADDIYAVGATLYELLTSKPPFFRGNVQTILHQVATEVPPPMWERREEFGITGRRPIPHVWEEAVAQCLAKDSEARPRSLDEILRAFRQPSGAGGAAVNSYGTRTRVNPTVVVRPGTTARRDRPALIPPSVEEEPMSARQAPRRWGGVLVMAALTGALTAGGLWRLASPDRLADVQATPQPQALAAPIIVPATPAPQAPAALEAPPPAALPAVEVKATPVSAVQVLAVATPIVTRVTKASVTKASPKPMPAPAPPVRPKSTTTKTRPPVKSPAQPRGTTFIND